jgi:hypothetical protein
MPGSLVVAFYLKGKKKYSELCPGGKNIVSLPRNPIIP